MLKILCETHHVKHANTFHFQNSLLKSSVLAMLCLHATCYLAFLSVQQVSFKLINTEQPDVCFSSAFQSGT